MAASTAENSKELDRNIEINGEEMCGFTHPDICLLPILCPYSLCLYPTELESWYDYIDLITYSVTLVKLVEVEVAVLPPRAAAIGQYAAAGHHHRPGFLVCHGGGKVEVVWVVRRDADLDAARPLLHQTVDADLEELVVLQRPENMPRHSRQA